MHRLNSGSYPRDQAEFEEIGPDLPLDAITRAPYRFALADDAVRIWSPGGDFRDDGGDPENDWVLEIGRKKSP